MTALKNEVGNRYTRLTVVCRAPSRNKVIHWECACDCGNTHIASGENLRSNHVRSCGCLAKDVTSARSIKHSMSNTPEYTAWRNMLLRCYNPNDPRSRNYLARGIKVCDRWVDDFSAFFADMGPRPSAKHSIDRIDNNGNYAPENCRWATQKVQMNNTRRNTHVVIDGESKTIQQWADALGVGRHVVIKMGGS